MSEQTIGKRIQALRKERGMTQKQLAAAVGVTPQAVSKWETDESCPDITALPLLAQTLGTSVDELLGGKRTSEPVLSGEVRDADVPTEEEPVYTFEYSTRKISAIMGGVFLLLAGALMILFKTCPGWFGEVGLWDLLWPSAIIFIGLGGCTSRNFSGFSLGIVAIGALFLLKNIGVIEGSVWPIGIAAVLMVVGASTILHQIFKKKKRVRVGRHTPVGDNRATRARSNYHEDGGFIRYHASFADDCTAAHVDRLSGGEVSTSFGDFNLDLTGVREVADGATLNASISFGELTLHMPRHIRTELETSGAFSERGIKGGPDPDAPYVLRVKAGANFGEFSVVYDD